MILDWKRFVLRSDIKNLPLEEQRRKFLEEQLYHDNLLSEQIQRQKQYDFYMSQMQPKGGAGGGGFSGQAIDGPISGATVTSNVGTTTTNALGEFTLPSRPTGPITITGGTDAITGVAFEGELVGYPEYKTISPITTFAHYLKEASEEDEEVATLTIDEAVTKTFVSSSDYFGIDLPVENKDTILQRDYVKEAIENNNKVGVSAQAVATQIESITETVGVALDGSVVATKSRDKGDTIPQFSSTNRKRTAYAALGRQVLGQGRIIPATITRDVVFFNPLNGRVEKGGVEFENDTALGTQLTATIDELTELAKQEQFTNNYLTTRIQAVNRAQKTTIKNETRDAVENRGSFSNINEVSTSREVEDALKQIEKDKANETTPVLDGTPQPIFSPTFYQAKKDKFGNESVIQLDLKGVEKSYAYFGKAKDLPILMRAILPKEPGGETTYAVAEFPYSADFTTGISLDAPCEIRTSSVNDETNITTNTTYTFRPFVSSKDEEGYLVGLRLSDIKVVEEKPKAVTHIADSGTYTPSFTTSGGGQSMKMAARIVEDPSGNRLDIGNEIQEVAYKLLPTKVLGEFNLNQVDPKQGTETTLKTGIKFDSKNVATFSYDRLGPGGEEKVTWTISYEADNDDDGGGSAVDHIVSAYQLGSYSYSMTLDGSGRDGLRSTMTKNDGLKGGNFLTLSSYVIAPGVTLNNIRLAASPGGFALTAGNPGDEYTIQSFPPLQSTFNSDNVWQATGVALVEGGKTYTITITYSIQSVTLPTPGSPRP